MPYKNSETSSLEPQTSFLHAINQQPGNSYQEKLQKTSINCGLRDATAEEYRNELVRDAFVNGIASHSIRQRLLENSELTITQAFDNARSLRTAQEHSAAYLNQTEVASILPQQDTCCFNRG